MKKLVLTLFLSLGFLSAYPQYFYPRTSAKKTEKTEKSKKQTTTFRNAGDVWAYLSGRTFTKGSTTIRISPQYVEINYSPMSGAPIIKSITSTKAYLVATFPMLGNQQSSIIVDCQNGTLTNGGDVFRSK